MNRSVLVAGVGVLALAALAVWFGQKPPGGADPAARPESDLAVEERAARDAVRARPNDPAAHARLARAVRRLGRPAEAEAEVLRAIQLGLPQPEAQREVVLLKAARDWPPEMDGLFRRVARENPDDPELSLALADAYFARERWLDAEPLYTRLLARETGRAEWRFKRGTARMRAAFYATAAEDFRAVLADDPGSYEARLYLGHSLLGDAYMAEAERELRVCRHQRPAAPEPLVGLATCALERNDLGAAEQLLDEAARAAGESPLVLQEQATLFLRQERTDRAIAALARLVALAPNHRQGHLQLSQAYLAAGDAAGAARHEAIYKELDRKEEQRLAARRGMR